HFQPVDADRQKSAFVQPTLLASNNGLASKYVHDLEVFGPVATLIAYDNANDLIPMVRRGNGSLVASIFSNDPALLREVVLGVGDHNFPQQGGIVGKEDRKSTRLNSRH